jgi:hypothetical protein
MIRYNSFTNRDNEIIFDKAFFMRTVGLLAILALYFFSFILLDANKNLASFILLNVIFALVIFTHSLYNWFSTFVNDLIYNALSGFSVVSDEEVALVLKNYNNPRVLEDSQLLKLGFVACKVKNGDVKTPIDALKLALGEAIEDLKPSNYSTRRVKENLKYHLLTMFVFDGAEEGQILWELGFDEYPVRIMSRERNLRKPLFEVKSPSDYTYTSRNAFLALKKEAIHDITWRISYLEKLSKR